MKRLLFLLALAAGLNAAAKAQTTDTASNPGYTAGPGIQPVSPTIRAARQLNMLQKKLNLNQDQVVKLRMILLHLNVALDSLRSNPSADKKAANQARRAITHDADVQTYSLLNTDQQVIYTQWKQDEQTRRRLNRAARNGAPPPQQN